MVRLGKLPGQSGQIFFFLVKCYIIIKSKKHVFLYVCPDFQISPNKTLIRHATCNDLSLGGHNRLLYYSIQKLSIYELLRRTMGLWDVVTISVLDTGMSLLVPY